jgi:hypothetical protein
MLGMLVLAGQRMLKKERPGEDCNSIEPLESDLWATHKKVTPLCRGSMLASAKINRAADALELAAMARSSSSI